MVLFAFLSFTFIHSTKKYAIYLVGIFSLLAAYSFGNGFIAFGLNIFVLLIQKEYKKTGVILLFFLPFILNYVFFYEKGAETLTSFDVNRFVGIFLSLTGGIFINVSQEYGFPITIMAGLIAFLSTLWYFYKGVFSEFSKHFTPTNLLLYFCLISLFLIAVARSGSGIFIFRSSRYLFYSPLIFTGLYIQLIRSTVFVHLKSLPIYLLIVVITVFISISSFYFNTELLFNRKKNTIADSDNWKHNFSTISISPRMYANIQDELKNSYQNGICETEIDLRNNKPGKQIYSGDIKIKNNLRINHLDLSKDVINKSQNNNYIYLEFGKLSLPNYQRFSEWYVCFKSKKTNFEFFTPLVFKRGSKKNLVLKFDYFSNEGTTSIWNLQIPEGHYDVYFVQKTDQLSYYQTDVELIYGMHLMKLK
ncbi:hypothetical protein V7S76_04775 [Aquirufa sp. ROCK2-A2]